LYYQKKPLAKKARDLLLLINENPFTDPPPFEVLIGDLKGATLAASIFSTDWCIRSLKRKKS